MLRRGMMETLQLTRPVRDELWALATALTGGKASLPDITVAMQEVRDPRQLQLALAYFVRESSKHELRLPQMRWRQVDPALLAEQHDAWALAMQIDAPNIADVVTHFGAIPRHCAWRLGIRGLVRVELVRPKAAVKGRR